MPTLKDTEWRVLCVVVRQTLGWREKGGARRTHDWLTQQQLKRRTGRNTEALSKAIAVLTTANLLEVRDSHDGNVLVSSAARRRYRGKLYFGLHPTVLARVQSQKDESKIERTAPKGELRKSNTTKETETKEIKTKEKGTNHYPSENNLPLTIWAKTRAQNSNPVESVTGNVPTHSMKISKQMVKSAFGNTEPALAAAELAGQTFDPRIVEDTNRLLQSYQRMFQEYRRQSPNLRLSAEDTNAIKALLAEHSYEQLEALLQMFFNSSIAYFERQNYSLQVFAISLPILKLLKSPGGLKRRADIKHE